MSLDARSTETQLIYTCSEKLTTGSGGKTWALPSGSGKMSQTTIRIRASSGSCYVETSNTRQTRVASGDAVLRTLTDLGTVTNEDKDIIIGPISAIRLVRVSGTVVMEVEAQ